jgi:hypothetical protein
MVNEILHVQSDGFVQWKRDGQAISGETGLDFKPILSGVYSVQVSNGGCVKESTPYEFLITGIDPALNQIFDVQVYPVPATSRNIQIQISTIESGPVTIELLDILGKTHFNETLSTSQLRNPYHLETRFRFPGGIYFITATQGQLSIKKKIIIAD